MDRQGFEAMMANAGPGGAAAMLQAITQMMGNPYQGAPASLPGMPHNSFGMGGMAQLATQLGGPQLGPMAGLMLPLLGAISPEFGRLANNLATGPVNPGLHGLAQLHAAHAQEMVGRAGGVNLWSSIGDQFGVPFGMASTFGAILEQSVPGLASFSRMLDPTGGPQGQAYVASQMLQAGRRMGGNFMMNSVALQEAVLQTGADNNWRLTAQDESNIAASLVANGRVDVSVRDALRDLARTDDNDELRRLLAENSDASPSRLATMAVSGGLVTANDLADRRQSLLAGQLGERGAGMREAMISARRVLGQEASSESIMSLLSEFNGGSLDYENNDASSRFKEYIRNLGVQAQEMGLSIQEMVQQVSIVQARLNTDLETSGEIVRRNRSAAGMASYGDVQGQALNEQSNMQIEAGIRNSDERAGLAAIVSGMSEDDRRRVYARVESGESLDAIAADFNVSEALADARTNAEDREWYLSRANRLADFGGFMDPRDRARVRSRLGAAADMSEEDQRLLAFAAVTRGGFSLNRTTRDAVDSWGLSEDERTRATELWRQHGASITDADMAVALVAEANDDQFRADEARALPMRRSMKNLARVIDDSDASEQSTQRLRQLVRDLRDSKEGVTIAGLQSAVTEAFSASNIDPARRRQVLEALDQFAGGAQNLSEEDQRRLFGGVLEDAVLGLSGDTVEAEAEAKAEANGAGSNEATIQGAETVTVSGTSVTVINNEQTNAPISEAKGVS